MFGDFNEAMWQEEHFSLSRRLERLMANFREALYFYDLHDIGFLGSPCTFDNKQKGDRNVRVRLDRAVATPSWSTFFLQFRLRHLSSSRSDHCPLLLEAEQVIGCRSGSFIRRYEIA
jgi:endonuclease/exonuclease/phosphatase family metal-dependent hydrolase